MKKKILMIVLAFSLTFSLITNYVFADDHTHQPDLTQKTVAWITFEEYNAQKHKEILHIVAPCIVCGEQIETGDKIVSFSNHSFDCGEYWTGQHYHSGNRHYYYVLRDTCYCGYQTSTPDSSTGTWVSYPCIGDSNGNGCIIPYSLPEDVELS